MNSFLVRFLGKCMQNFRFRFQPRISLWSILSNNPCLHCFDSSWRRLVHEIPIKGFNEMPMGQINKEKYFRNQSWGKSGWSPLRALLQSVVLVLWMLKVFCWKGKAITNLLFQIYSPLGKMFSLLCWLARMTSSYIFSFFLFNFFTYFLFFWLHLSMFPWQHAFLALTPYFKFYRC